MTKEEFLKDFDDINFMYNNAMMKDSLERHIDELTESIYSDLAKAIGKYCECHGIYDWGIIEFVENGGKE